MKWADKNKKWELRRKGLKMSLVGGKKQK